MFARFTKMHTYKNEYFEKDQRKEALLFARKVKGTCKYTQAIGAEGTARGVYCVSYIPQEAKA